MKWMERVTKVIDFKFFTRLILLISLAMFLVRLARVFLVSVDVGAAEPYIIFALQSLLQDNALYLPPELPPFSVTQYSYWHYYSCAFIAKLFSISSQDILQLYCINRGLALLWNVLAVMVLYKIGRKFFSLSIETALLIIAAAFFLFGFAHFGRADGLYILQQDEK